MPSTTRGFPYPLSTEPVAEGAAAIQALAEAVEARYGASATTVAALDPDVDGRQALIRVGSTPYSFLGLVYDATLAKWVSPELWLNPAPSDTDGLLSNTDVLTITEYNAAHRHYLPYKAFKDAGLSMQLRLIGFCQHTATEIAHFRLGFDPVNAGGTKGATPTWSAWALDSASSSSETMRDSGWQAEPAITATDYVGLAIGGYRNSGGTTKVAAIRHPLIGYRWVS